MLHGHKNQTLLHGICVITLHSSCSYIIVFVAICCSDSVVLHLEEHQKHSTLMKCDWKGFCYCFFFIIIKRNSLQRWNITVQWNNLHFGNRCPDRFLRCPGLCLFHSWVRCTSLGQEFLHFFQMLIFRCNSYPWHKRSVLSFATAAELTEDEDCTIF